MNEDFLQYVWQYKMFSKIDFKTTDGEDVTILKAGLHNKNAGPDFLNAAVKIGAQKWIGNVEVHIKSSDWYVHKHETDANYDAVILHVVWEHDAIIYMENNQPIPTLVLKEYVDNTDNYIGWKESNINDSIDYSKMYNGTIKSIAESNYANLILDDYYKTKVTILPIMVIKNHLKEGDKIKVKLKSSPDGEKIFIDNIVSNAK